MLRGEGRYYFPAARFDILSHMRFNRPLAYLSGCVTIAASLLIYLEYIHGLGFPDGFITELGYAERNLARVLIVISIMLGASFIYLGVVGGRELIGRKLSVAIILYVTFIISVSVIDYYCRLYLSGSGGG